MLPLIEMTGAINTAALLLQMRQNLEILNLDSSNTTQSKPFLTLPEVEAQVLKMNTTNYDTPKKDENGLVEYENVNLVKPDDFNLSQSNFILNDVFKSKDITTRFRAYKSATESSCDNESSSESAKCCSSPYRRKLKKVKKLPPIGVFWDIENCQVPRGRSAAGVVKQIREYFFNGYREAEFLVVCDVKKENGVILQELNDAQVNLIHVASTCKNAADEKLRQAIRRFADIHKFPSAIVLISSDINFAPELSDLRHRKRIHIILLHNYNVSEALILCANEHYIFQNITEQAPLRNKSQGTPKQEMVEITIWNLPEGYDIQRLKARLKQLSDNCGGKVVNLNTEKGTANVIFKSLNVGIRAQKRMDGEDVYGHRITVGYPRPYTWEKPQSPFKQQNIGTKATYRTENSNYQQPIAPAYWNGYQTRISENALPTSSVSPINEHNLKEQQRFLKTNMQDDECVHLGFRRIRGAHGNSTLKDSINSELGVNYLRSDRTDNIASSLQDSMFNGTSFISHECKTFNNFQTGFQSHKSWPQSESSFDLISDNNLFEHSFQPIRNYPNNEEMVEANNTLIRNNHVQQNVELIVTNLDSNIERGQMRRTLLSLFRKHAHVLDAGLFKQLDGNVAATIKVASHMDAQIAISQLHRHRIGHKRIAISYANSSGTNPQQLRAQIIGLLQDVPDKKLPVFKFRELFETRYLTSISMPELYRLRDICSIIGDPSGRMIALNSDSLSSSSSPDSNLHELIYCLKHNNPDKTKGWAEMEISELPNIRIGLKIFSGRLHMLLQSHKGTLPLQSFQACYEAVIREPLPIDHTGVPLEHLITCVAGVDLQQGPAKQIIWSPQTSSDDVTEDGSSYSGLLCGSQSPNTPLASQLALFSRELVDLLRTKPNCRLSFNKFIPAYHHHFGRQCRVADYGFTKLAELFESMPHVIQILGEGNKRTITLSHRTQIRRFTGDLVRILKGSASRQVTINEFPAAAEKTLGKVWDPIHYGVCDLDDLLSAIPEHIVVVTSLQDSAVIALPKREQTVEEMNKTQQFGIQVIELLRHEPQCTMLFSHFVPAYHHYFNQQCRVADYGFIKLIELFEAIPEIVQIEEPPGEERVIRLTIKEALRVLSNQISQLILCSTNKGFQGIPISEIPTHFLRKYGYTLRSDAYNCISLHELLEKIDDSIMIIDNMVMLVDRSVFRTLGLRLWRILMQLPNYCSTSTTLLQNYRSIYNQHYELNQLQQISSVVKLTTRNNETIVELTPLHIFAARAYTILYENNSNNMNLTMFQNLYKQRYGILNPEDADCPNINALINSLPDILVVSTRGVLRITLSINPQLENVGVPLPESVDSIKVDKKVQEEKISTWSYSETESYNQNNHLESNVQGMLWPTKMYSTAPSYSPPKPDTPPSNSATSWNELWGSPPSSTYNYNLSIPMPISEVNNLPDSPVSLISPARYLLPAYVNPFGEQSVLMSPPASALPQPNLDTETESCESKSESNNQKSPTTPNRCRRKLRVAAQFKSPISL